MGRIGRLKSRVVLPIIASRHGATIQRVHAPQSHHWQPPAILLENLAALNESAIIVEHSRHRIRELVGNSSLCRYTQQTIMATVSQTYDRADDEVGAQLEPMAAKRSRRNCDTVRELFSISRMMRSDICSACPLADQSTCCYIEASQTLFDEADGDGDGDGDAELADRSPEVAAANAQHPELSCTKTQCYSIQPKEVEAVAETGEQPESPESPDDVRPLRRSLAFQMRGGGGGRLTPNAVMYSVVAADDGAGPDPGSSADELLPDERLFVSRSVRQSWAPGRSRWSAGLSGGVEAAAAAERDSGGAADPLQNDGEWWEQEVAQQNSRITGLLGDLNELSSINLGLAADLSGKLTQ